MTGCYYRQRAGDPRFCDDGWENYRSGPVVAIESRGLSARLLIEAVIEQCEQRGVGIEVCPIDELTLSDDLYGYRGLIIALPTEVPARQDLAHAAAAIKRYRARVPHGIAAVRTGHTPWYKGGVIQLAGHVDTFDDPVLQAAVPLADAVHRLDQDCVPSTVDFFAVYAPCPSGTAALSAGTPHIDRITRALPRILEQWGIATPETAAAARQLIEDSKRRYRGSQFSKSRRPLPESDLNHLELILHDPALRPPKGTPEYKQFMENGALIAGRILDELRRQVDPGIRRPRAGTKGKQEDLHLLYRTLVAFTELSGR